MNIESIGHTFAERKQYLYQSLVRRYKFDEVTERLFALLVPIPLEVNKPLSDEIMRKLLDSNNIDDIKNELLQLLNLQNKYELRDLYEIKKQMELKKLEIIGQLGELKKKLLTTEPHEYRPDMREWIDDLRLDAKKINESYNQTIDMLEKWNKNESL